jgi:hypothetical protein
MHERSQLVQYRYRGSVTAATLCACRTAAQDSSLFHTQGFLISLIQKISTANFNSDLPLSGSIYLDQSPCTSTGSGTACSCGCSCSYSCTYIIHCEMWHSISKGCVRVRIISWDHSTVVYHCRSLRLNLLLWCCHQATVRAALEHCDSWCWATTTTTMESVLTKLNKKSNRGHIVPTTAKLHETHYATQRFANTTIAVSSCVIVLWQMIA